MRLLFIFFIFYCKFVSAENNTYNNLIKAVKAECSGTLAGNGIDCSIYEKTIEEKFNRARIYLNTQLIELIQADSSTYYEEKKKELDDLEHKKINNSKDSLIILIEKENLYLLTSVLKPSKSYEPFNKLIQNYYNIKTPILVQENSEVYYLYKIWLYELLQTRFPKEKAYQKNIGILHYNRGLQLLDEDFKDAITEQKLINKIDTLLQKSAKMDSLNFSYSSRMVPILLSEATKLTKNYETYPSENLYAFIESLYLRALSLNPEDLHANYNFGAFYYNQAVKLINSSRENTDEKEATIMMEKTKMLMEKAKPYLDKVAEIKKKEK